MALLFTACGSEEPTADTVDTIADQDGLRAPTPIEASGSSNVDGRAAAATEEMSADMMIAPAYIVTDYVVSPDMPPLPDNTTGYVFDAASEPTADQVAELAEAFGVAGEPERIDDGFAISWRVGPDDGSAPSIVLWDDAMLAWNFNAGWDEREVVACAGVSEPAVATDVAGSVDAQPGADESSASADAATPETIVAEPLPDDCASPEPPVNVPSAADAESMSTDYLNAIGVDPGSVTFDTYADEWSASVTANAMFDGVVAQSWGFTYGENALLQYAWGNAATPEPVGPYTLVDLDTAIERLKDGSYGFGGYAGRGDIAVMSDTVTNDSATLESGSAVNEAATDEPLPPPTGAENTPGVAPAVQDPFDEDMPVAIPEGEVGVAPGEPIPVEPDGGIGDGAEPPEPRPLPEPMPVDPMPEPEEITVTLVDVEPDLWWVWDVDGSAWLVPAYRFIGDDGGWYTVPAVTDDFLVQTEPPAPEPEPTPEPAPDTTPVPDPVDPVEPESVQRYVGLTLDEFTAEVEADGFGPVRIAELDGEPQALTMDFLPGRVSVSVETRDGVQYVVDASVEWEDVIVDTVPPTTDPITTVTDPPVDVVPIVGTYDGVSFYPACGTEVLDHEGVTWYTLAHDGAQATDPEFAKRLSLLAAVDREPSPVSGVNGFAVRVAEPGPGDDIGTLVVWDDGVARFVSDSGDLDVWLVDDELEYTWVC
jgi:hypothetical protein